MVLWKGRFSKELNHEVNAFNSSLSFDHRMYKQDIRGSLAHAKMLCKQSIIEEKDYEEIVEGLNAILKEDRAIVTDIEGTTRDTIEEFVTIDGIPFKFVDTAGIRKADNKVEEIGIEKSKKVAKESDLIIAMFDNSKKLTKEDEEILDFIKDKTAIIILNKIDLKEKILEQEERITKSGKDVIKISLLSNCDLSGFYKELNMLFELNKINPDNEIIITEMRHKKLIEDAISHTENAKKTILDNIPIDIISINIKEIIEDLSKITGENVTEDVINEIFSKFCLGK